MAPERSSRDKSRPDSFLPVKSGGCAGVAAAMVASTSVRVISADVISGELTSTCCMIPCVAAGTVAASASIVDARIQVDMRFIVRRWLFLSRSPMAARAGFVAVVTKRANTYHDFRPICTSMRVWSTRAKEFDNDSCRTRTTARLGAGRRDRRNAGRRGRTPPLSDTGASRLRFCLHEHQRQHAPRVGPVFLLDRCDRVDLALRPLRRSRDVLKPFPGAGSFRNHVPTAGTGENRHERSWACAGRSPGALFLILVAADGNPVRTASFARHELTMTQAC